MILVVGVDGGGWWWWVGVGRWGPCNTNVINRASTSY